MPEGSTQAEPVAPQKQKVREPVVVVKSHLIDHVDQLFRGQDGGETVTTRRRLKDKRNQEMRNLYNATIEQRLHTDPARVVMSNAYRQQYDDGVERPLMNSLLGGKYYGAKGRVVELGKPHGMSARIAGVALHASPSPGRSNERPTSQGAKPPPPSTRDACCDSIHRVHDDGVQVDAYSISQPAVHHYNVASAQPASKTALPAKLPFPQDDAHDYFGKKLKPKGSELLVPPQRKIAGRSIGTEPAKGPVPYVQEPPPKTQRVYRYQPPKHPAAPIRDTQTNTDISGAQNWKAESHRLPKMGLVTLKPFTPAQTPRPEGPASQPVSARAASAPRTARYSSRPLDTYKFLF